MWQCRLGVVPMQSLKVKDHFQAAITGSTILREKKNIKSSHWHIFLFSVNEAIQCSWYT